MTPEDWFGEVDGYGTGWVVEQALVSQENTTRTATLRDAVTGRVVHVRLVADLFPTP
jgi:hypothetical protein